MTHNEAIRILQKMKTRCFPDELSHTIQAARENEAIDIALIALRDRTPIKPNPSHVQLTSRVDVVFKYSCGNCGTYVREAWKACPICGKGICWDEIQNHQETDTPPCDVVREAQDSKGVP